MNDLLALAMTGHGGLDRWKAVKSIEVALTISGQLFEAKGFPEHLRTSILINVDKPHSVLRPYGGGRWWDDDWIRHDVNEHSPLPHQQLATAFAAAGERSMAEEIRYLGRVRERETERGLGYFWSGFLQYVAGFGIGTYTFTFRVLYWVIGIALAGAALLWWTVPAVRTEHRGPFWCVGATLARLLPVIEINKEFTDFFDDPDRQHLKAWQSILFSGFGIVGFVLGAILIAAVSGLTQSS